MRSAKTYRPDRTPVGWYALMLIWLVVGIVAHYAYK